MRWMCLVPVLFGIPFLVQGGPLAPYSPINRRLDTRLHDYSTSVGAHVPRDTGYAGDHHTSAARNTGARFILRNPSRTNAGPFDIRDSFSLPPGMSFVPAEEYHSRGTYQDYGRRARFRRPLRSRNRSRHDRYPPIKHFPNEDRYFHRDRYSQPDHISDTYPTDRGTNERRHYDHVLQSPFADPDAFRRTQERAPQRYEPVEPFRRETAQRRSFARNIPLSSPAEINGQRSVRREISPSFRRRTQYPETTERGRSRQSYRFINLTRYPPLSYSSDSPMPISRSLANRMADRQSLGFPSSRQYDSYPSTDGYRTRAPQVRRYLERPPPENLGLTIPTPVDNRITRYSRDQYSPRARTIHRDTSLHTNSRAVSPAVAAAVSQGTSDLLAADLPLRASPNLLANDLASIDRRIPDQPEVPNVLPGAATSTGALGDGRVVDRPPVLTSSIQEEPPPEPVPLGQELAAIEQEMRALEATQLGGPTNTGVSGMTAPERMVLAPLPAVPVDRRMVVPAFPSLEEVGRKVSQSINGGVRPCHDFYKFACGKWKSENSVISEKGYIDIFTDTAVSIQDKLSDLLEAPDLLTDKRPVSSIKQFYRTCMASEGIVSVQQEDLMEALQDMGLAWPVLGVWRPQAFNLETWLGIARQFLGNRQDQNGILVGLNVRHDIVNPKEYSIFIEQPDLGLKHTEIFLSGRKSPEVQAYEQYAIESAISLGALRSAARKDMEKLVDFEIEVAKLMVTTNNYDYKTIALKDMSKNYGKFNWRRFLKSVFSTSAPNAVKRTTNVVMNSQSYFNKLFSLIRRTPKRTLANYVIWRMLMPSLPTFGSAFRQAELDLNKVLFGQTQLGTHRRFCSQLANTHMGFIAARMYVDNYIGKPQLREAAEIAEYVHRALKHKLQHLHWMDNATRAVSLKKLNGLIKEIGVPDYVFDDKFLQNYYFEVPLTRNALENSLGIRRFNTMKQLQVITGKKVNRWQTGPVSTATTYDNGGNVLGVAAGLFEEPFYSPKRPRSMVFGSLGFLISRELTKTFDSIGRHFAENGVLRNWWTNETAARYEKDTECYKKAYSKYNISSVNMAVDGERTQLGNVADAGGLKIGKMAYDLWLKDKGHDTLLPRTRFDDAQLFYIGYGQTWCGRYSDAYTKKQLRYDNNSPPFLRVNELLRNEVDFSRAFQCSTRNQMVSTKRCGIW